MAGRSGYGALGIGEPAQCKRRTLGAQAAVFPDDDGTRPPAENLHHLPLASLDRLSIQNHVDEIGRSKADPDDAVEKNEP